MNSSFTLHKPEDSEKQIPLIFDSPHSGTEYPDDFNHSCPREKLLKTADHFVDELFAPVTDYGATFLTANFPRCYIDLNRRIDDIDPDLIGQDWPENLLPFTANPSARCKAGIGLIRRTIANNMAVYDQKLTPEQITVRIAEYYVPYHDKLEELITRTHDTYGQVWHINCHSMPDHTARPKRNPTLHGQSVQHADFCLGNHDGTTCSNKFTNLIRDFLTERGHHVTINDPFAGVELIRRHAAPTRGIHSLQIEINKKLYMNEETSEKNEGFEKLKQTLEHLTAHCRDYIKTQLD